MNGEADLIRRLADDPDAYRVTAAGLSPAYPGSATALAANGKERR